MAVAPHGLMRLGLLPLLASGLSLPLAGPAARADARPAPSAWADAYPAPSTGAALTFHVERVDVNELAMFVSNVGSFAWDLNTFNPGLEYPRGSGKPLAYAAGIWLAGKAGGQIRTALAEYYRDFVPGPIIGGTWSEDTVRFTVYKVARTDTAGWAAWVARAAPLGAPLDTTGTRPGITGDQTLWTVFNDANPALNVASRNRGTPRTPIGVEVQLTVYAFDRSGPLEDAVFLHYRIIHKGTTPMDSAYVGLFLDPHPGPSPTPAACDTSLDLGYAYRSDTDYFYGSAGPAVGLDLLRGPRDPATGERRRMTSFVAYANGTDPADSLQFYDTLRGDFPWGAPMIDPTTGQALPFYAPGDPVTGSGWVSPTPSNVHTVLAAGPFTFAPGDTQLIDAALIVAQGADRLASVTELRRVSLEIQRLFDKGFASAPPHDQLSAVVEARPNPFDSEVRLVYRVPGNGAAVRVVAYDLSGRRVRVLADEWQLPGARSLSWDGADDDGRLLPAGVYFVRSSVAGRVSKTRVVLLR